MNGDPTLHKSESHAANDISRTPITPINKAHHNPAVIQIFRKLFNLRRAMARFIKGEPIA